MVGRGWGEMNARSDGQLLCRPGSVFCVYAGWVPLSVRRGLLPDRTHDGECNDRPRSRDLHYYMY